MPVIKMGSNPLDVIPTWGPEFEVSLEVYVNEWNTKDDWNDILRVSKIGTAHGDKGNKIPHISTYKGPQRQHKQLVIETQIGGDGLWRKDLSRFGGMSTKTWHKMVLKQYARMDGKVPSLFNRYQILKYKFSCSISLR